MSGTRRLVALVVLFFALLVPGAAASPRPPEPPPVSIYPEGCYPGFDLGMHCFLEQLP